jgi:transcriptional antiterminator RfaH
MNDTRLPLNELSPRRGSYQWHAVQTRPRQEQRAEANLAAWGVETLLPMIRGRARTPRSRVTQEGDALFPSYLFARFDAPTMAAKIRYTRGVAKILGASEHPSVVDDSIIAEIRTRIGNDGYVRLVSPLTPGDPVRITNGVLRDFVGVFEASLEPSHRLRLLLSAVHGQVRVTIDEGWVEKVSAGC